MAWFIQIQFSDGRWQRSDRPFMTGAEAVAKAEEMVDDLYAALQHLGRERLKYQVIEE